MDVSPGITFSPTSRNLLTRNELICFYYLAGYTTSRVQLLIASDSFFLSKRHIRVRVGKPQHGSMEALICH